LFLPVHGLKGLSANLSGKKNRAYLKCIAVVIVPAQTSPKRGHSSADTARAAPWHCEFQVENRQRGVPIARFSHLLSVCAYQTHVFSAALNELVHTEDVTKLSFKPSIFLLNALSDNPKY
jgi:hypothetical protein